MYFKIYGEAFAIHSIIVVSLTRAIYSVRPAFVFIHQDRHWEERSNLLFEFLYLDIWKADFFVVPSCNDDSHILCSSLSATNSINHKNYGSDNPGSGNLLRSQTLNGAR